MTYIYLSFKYSLVSYIFVILGGWGGRGVVVIVPIQSWSGSSRKCWSFILSYFSLFGTL